MEDDVERVALAITQAIGWGTFSHFNPDDVRRISRAAIAALRSPADVDLREAEALRERVMKVIEGGYKPIIDRHQQDQCIHSRMVGIEDCIGCYDEALVAALSSG